MPPVMCSMMVSPDKSTSYLRDPCYLNTTPPLGHLFHIASSFTEYIFCALLNIAISMFGFEYFGLFINI